MKIVCTQCIDVKLVCDITGSEVLIRKAVKICHNKLNKSKWGRGIKM